MNATMLKFSPEEKQKFAEAVLGDATSKLLANIKEANADDGRFKVVFTSGSLDRHGETVNPDGWDFTNYMNNPVVLYAHDYCSLPIGMVEKITRDGDNWIAEGMFASADMSPMAGYVAKLYKAGFLKTVSVGFLPTEMDAEYNSLKQELLEISFVPVPANPDALSLAKELGLNIEEMKQKGFFKDAEPEPKADEPKADAEPTPAPEPKPEEEKAVLENRIKTLEEEIATIKAGRVLSEANRSLIKDTADGMRAATRSMDKCVSALEDLLKSTEPSSGDNQDPSGGGQKDVNIVVVQRLIRIADKSIEDALRVIGRNLK
jgi:HK97 family phage prohead protease